MCLGIMDSQCSVSGMFYHIKTKADRNVGKVCQCCGDKMNLSTDSRGNHLLTGETLLTDEAELE